MINGLKVVVVMPAFNAAKTLERTYREIPGDIVDNVLLVDDQSSDRTSEIARKLSIKHVVHHENRGYGANQKTCYTLALGEGADIVVMIHPDYQYPPKLIPAMAAMIASREFDMVIGSRILGTGALRGGMPLYKYISNRFLTFIQNILVNHKLSEYHTGFRAFSREVLLSLPLAENSDDFLFDNQMLVQAIHFNFRLGEISCPTRYRKDSSSINFRRSLKYGFGVLWTSVAFLLYRRKIAHFKFLDPDGRKLPSHPSL